MSKIVKKILFEDSWQIGQNVRWFSDMAAKGLHLKSLGRLWAVFEKGVPSQTRYEAVLLDEMPSQQEIMCCRGGGWRLAANRGKFYFFASEQSDNALTFYIDTKKQEEAACNLERQHRKSLVLILVAMLIFLVAMSSVLVLNNEPFLSMVRGAFVQQILLVGVELYVFYTVIRSFIWARRLKKSLLENKPLGGKANWKNHRLLNRAVSTLFLSIAVFTVFIPILQIIRSESYTLSEAKTDLPVIRLSEVEENPLLKRESGYNSRGVDWGNRVSYDWSLLAPIQLEVDEQGIVDNEMWEDNSGIYSPSIHTQFYQLAFNKMTDGLLHDLMKRYLYNPDSRPSKVENSSFDELYIIEEDLTKQIFACWENKVIYVRYHGKKDIEHIIASISRIK
ncbi:MAG: hypothetical protein K0S71_2269 [Clostridia bacterium]|jgi:hypothetical protein|nr:hypothetical protein [Clostridia bacterium]